MQVHGYGLDMVHEIMVKEFHEVLYPEISSPLLPIKQFTCLGIKDQGAVSMAIAEEQLICG